MSSWDFVYTNGLVYSNGTHSPVNYIVNNVIIHDSDLVNSYTELGWCLHNNLNKSVRWTSKLFWQCGCLSIQSQRGGGGLSLHSVENLSSDFSFKSSVADTKAKILVLQKNIKHLAVLLWLLICKLNEQIYAYADLFWTGTYLFKDTQAQKENHITIVMGMPVELASVEQEK